MNRRAFFHRSVAVATLASTIAEVSTASSSGSKADPATARDGCRDFDYFIGHWSVSAKRLRRRLIDDQTWEPVTGTTRVFQILHGSGNVDEDEFQLPGQTYIGGMLRLFDARQNIWNAYGLDRDTGVPQQPLSGRFVAGHGEFFGEDEEAGRRIKVRHLYANLTPLACRWEQAFSADDGKSWETNWIIEFTRLVSATKG